MITKDQMEIILGKISHDFKKPLSNLVMFSKILPMKKDDEAFITKSISDIQNDAEKVQEFLFQLRKFIQETESLPEDLEETLRKL